ncbi:hypothetical protein DFQ28_010415 [Apophysomyces sp. BC1034]|nr:hypothetical protein DFQ30_000971 [Apophysomyces sp. BC1015]KAG0192030.1 hypothetical protein DFQ28_010415 [Apophysomyces sp. BC1034]
MPLDPLTTRSPKRIGGAASANEQWKWARSNARNIPRPASDERWKVSSRRVVGAGVADCQEQPSGVTGMTWDLRSAHAGWQGDVMAPRTSPLSSPLVTHVPSLTASEHRGMGWMPSFSQILRRAGMFLSAPRALYTTISSAVARLFRSPPVPAVFSAWMGNAGTSSPAARWGGDASVPQIGWHQGGSVADKDFPSLPSTLPSNMALCQAWSPPPLSPSTGQQPTLQVSQHDTIPPSRPIAGTAQSLEPSSWLANAPLRRWRSVPAGRLSKGEHADQPESTSNERNASKRTVYEPQLACNEILNAIPSDLETLLSPTGAHVAD